MRWNALRQPLNSTSLESRLAGLAAAGEIVKYGALAREFGLRIADLTFMLEALMEVDAAKGRPLHAALCSGRLTQEMPAEGFFLKALALGFDIHDRARFVQDQRLELHRLHR